MSLECLLSNCLISSNVQLTFEATDTDLLEKRRNTATYLQITYHKFSITDNLLSLSKVGNITFIINSSCKVSGALLFIGTPRYDRISYILCSCYSC